MLNRRTLSTVLVGFTGFAALQVSLAHHGWSGQQDVQFELSGTLHTQLSLNGAHATMRIQDDQGNVWDVTLGPGSRTSRAGLKEDTIPVGAAVTVSGHRNSNSDRREIKTERVIYNGTNYDVYPNRL